MPIDPSGKNYLRIKYMQARDMQNKKSYKWRFFAKMDWCSKR